MFYVYVLRSHRANKCISDRQAIYGGGFGNTNEGEVVSTKLRRPFELIYYEAYKSERDCRLRESRLKLRSKAFTQLKRRIGNSLT